MKTYKINETIEFGKEYESKDFKNISLINVKGTISEVDNEYKIDLFITGKLQLLDHNSFNYHDYNLNIYVCEIDDFEINDDLFYKTLDFKEKMWENIVVELPTVYKVDELKQTSGNGWKVVDEDNASAIDERFAPLLQLLEKDNEEVS